MLEVKLLGKCSIGSDREPTTHSYSDGGTTLRAMDVTATAGSLYVQDSSGLLRLYLLPRFAGAYWVKWFAVCRHSAFFLPISFCAASGTVFPSCFVVDFLLWSLSCLSPWRVVSGVSCVSGVVRFETP